MNARCTNKCFVLKLMLLCCHKNGCSCEFVGVCGTVKPPDAVSVTSCDSGDSIQSTVHTQASVPISSSSSTLSEDCSSESGLCKSPPLVASIDLELLRQEEPILDVVSPAVQHSPPKSVLDSDAESAAYGANGNASNAVDCTDCCNPVQNEVKIPDSLVPDSAVRTDDDFESIYSRNMTVFHAEQTALEMSLDDAIMKSLMTSHPGEFRDVVRPVSFIECADGETGSENNANVESRDEELPVSRHITLPESTRNTNHVSCSSLANGTRQSALVNHWVQLPTPANMKSMSVSSRHIWITDVSGQLFYSLLRGPGLHWFMVTTAPAQQVSVSPSGSLVWRLDSGSVYAARNVSSRQPWGNKWSEVARDVTGISVDDNVAW